MINFNYNYSNDDDDDVSTKLLSKQNVYIRVDTLVEQTCLHIFYSNRKQHQLNIKQILIKNDKKNSTTEI